MKPYELRIQMSITDTSTAYNSVTALKFEINETFPPNVDAQKYVRQRMAEEVTRAFGKLTAPIENFADEKKAEADPLADAPF